MSYPESKVMFMSNTPHEKVRELLAEITTASQFQEALVQILYWIEENGMISNDNVSYVVEKPWKFPEYWIPAIEGNLDEFSADDLIKLYAEESY